MNLAHPSDACKQWLQDALRSLGAARALDLPATTDLALSQERLLAAVCAGDRARAQRICEVHDRDSGQPRASVMDLILPAVHRIEMQWLGGERSYSEVLHAFWHLQHLLQAPDERAGPPLPDAIPAAQGRVVLATAPGCEHTLGVLVVSESFRSWGWEVHTVLEGSRPALIQEVMRRSIDVLGLSVGHDAGLQGLADLLRELRASSRNPALQIMLGGNVFDMPPAQYDWIGADHVAASPHDALQFCASKLLRPTH